MEQRITNFDDMLRVSSEEKFTTISPETLKYLQEKALVKISNILDYFDKDGVVSEKYEQLKLLHQLCYGCPPFGYSVKNPGSISAFDYPEGKRQAFMGLMEQQKEKEGISEGTDTSPAADTGD